MISPCKECDRRVLGCHDGCEDYQQFRKWAQAKNERERAAKRSEYFYREQTYKFGHGEWWK